MGGGGEALWHSVHSGKGQTQGHDRAGPFLVYSLWFLDNAKVVTRCGLKALPGILSLSRFFFTYLLLSHSFAQP